MRNQQTCCGVERSQKPVRNFARRFRNKGRHLGSHRQAFWVFEEVDLVRSERVQQGFFLKIAPVVIWALLRPSISLVLLASSLSWATDEYPGLIEAKYGKRPVDDCALCHTNGSVGLNTVNTLFGKAMRQRFLVANTPSSLDTALNSLEMDHVDNDKDGVTDIDELKVGTSPNRFNSTGRDGGGGVGSDPIVPLAHVRYGCGSSVIPTLFGLASLVPWLRRRRNSKAVSPSEPSSL